MKLLELYKIRKNDKYKYCPACAFKTGYGIYYSEKETENCPKCGLGININPNFYIRNPVKQIPDEYLLHNDPFLMGLMDYINGG